MSSLDLNYRTLVVFFEEIRLIIQNIENSRSIKPILNEATRWEVLTRPQKEQIEKYFKTDPVPGRAMANSLFMSVTAGFENFLRNILSAVINEIERSKSIPVSLLHKNIQLSGVALSQLFSPPSHLRLDYTHITKTLYSCYSGDMKIQLNEEITGFIKSILDLENVFNFLKDCEIKITWDDFVKNENIKKLLNTVNARETGKLLKKQMDKYIEDRNRIAHTGLSSADLTISGVIEAMEYFLNIGVSLITECKEQLSKRNGA